MKTRGEILEGKYIVVNNGKEYVFENGTPIQTALKLLELKNNETRVVLNYGDLETGESWNEKYDVTGYVSSTRGHFGLRYLILCHNKRSIGGGIISTDKILDIKSSKGKQVLFKH